jgi:hypothetical protein
VDLLPKATIGEKVVADRIPRLEYTKFPCNRGFSRLKQNLIRIARKRQCQRRRLDGDVTPRRLLYYCGNHFHDEASLIVLTVMSSVDPCALCGEYKKPV